MVVSFTANYTLEELVLLPVCYLMWEVKWIFSGFLLHDKNIKVRKKAREKSFTTINRIFIAMFGGMFLIVL